MFLIVGLGNPEEKYNNTRHNIGFEAVDYIADKYNIDINRKKFKGVYGEGFIGNEKVILMKPTTYMNLSGECIREVIDFYKLSNEDILVIYDDISLDVGRIRIRPKGSAGGHNGIKSIINHLGTDEFSRIKIGVGQPKGDLVNHVLGKFSKEENEVLEESLEATKLATETIIKEDTQAGMNKFNGFKAKKSI
ncbi:aminoacyl-tRNA hydrolase [Clostridium baratii]|uniref:Peptidyl-tRNA hydrolase n=2 Tax=Clostridium TaxID=1485 RepID=A0ABN1LUV2_9CLOT|nr:aminoacyl-tRNA hydrolase [Clostridium baratii]AQM61030.1 aminoacyl-tRNA hydrolase [Clostridium baratii]KJU71974.1 peptidyl-tRNA hydrolase [Clostridium baratii]MBS6007889.1 aminoacyl-tRNA hydrolase [Clostridium baratii]MBS6042468.1 aminoacyl-tRNA hydrolase [Clostridium baratii]MBT9830835.1 aminoacyl-tRNA hydrolase [Clostridium baratii]